ncbi:MAG: hypothetical protein ACPHIA_04605 [Alphaproteobacteria bacterium]
MNRRDFLAAAVRVTVGFGAFGLWIVTLSDADAAERKRVTAFSPAFGTGFR